MNEHVFIEYSLCVSYGAKGEKHRVSTCEYVTVRISRLNECQFLEVEVTENKC